MTTDTATGTSPEEMNESDLRALVEEARQASLRSSAEFEPVAAAFSETRKAHDVISGRFMELFHILDVWFSRQRGDAVDMISDALGEHYRGEEGEQVPVDVALLMLNLSTKNLVRLADLVSKGLAVEADLVKAADRMER